MIELKKEYKLYKKGKYLKEASKLINQLDKIIQSDEIDIFHQGKEVFYYDNDMARISFKFNESFTNAKLDYFVISENHLAKINKLIEKFNNKEK